MINGGLPLGSVISIKGQHGCGKSIFGHQFLAYGCKKRQELSLLIILEEDLHELIASSLIFGWDFEHLAETQQLFIVDLTPLRNNSVDDLNEFIFPEDYSFIRQKKYTPVNFNIIIEKLITDLSPNRVVIDSITPVLIMNKDAFSARWWLSDLIRILKRKNITTMLISEINQPPTFDSIDMSITDGLISLNIQQMTNSKKRYLEIEKLRKTKHTLSPIVFRIGEDGINIFPDEPVFSTND